MKWLIILMTISTDVIARGNSCDSSLGCNSFIYLLNAGVAFGLVMLYEKLFGWGVGACWTAGIFTVIIMSALFK